MGIADTIKGAIEEVKGKVADRETIAKGPPPSVGSRLAARMRAPDLTTDDRRPRQSTRFRSRNRNGQGND